jgi:hypothetical protein
VVAFLILVAIIIAAVFRVTRSSHLTERGLGRREAARESRLILGEVKANAGVDEAVSPIKVSDENTIVHLGTERECSRSGQKLN